MSNWDSPLLRHLLAALVVVMAAGCSSEMKVSVLFEGTVPIEGGAAVIHAGQLVGEVEGAARKTNGTRIFLVLDRDRLAGLMHGSAARVVKLDGGAIGVEVFNYRAGERPLVGGDQLAALNDAVEYVAWHAGEAVEFTRSGFTAAAASVQTYFESGKWADQFEALGRDLAELGDGVHTAMAGLRDDYEALAAELRAQSGQSSEQVQRRYQELIGNLEMQIERFVQDGEQVMADSLERLLRSLEQLMQQHPDRKSTA